MAGHDNDDAGSTVTVLRVGSEAASELRLVAVRGEVVEAHDLPAVGRLVIGRSPAADIFFDHQSVSREHVVLEIQPTGVTLRDLDSHNGTLLSGRRLAASEEARFGLGDVAQLGAVKLFLERRVGGHDGRRDEEPITGLDEDGGELYRGAWLRRVWPVLRRIARGDIPVLLLGETGVGKEVLARLVHGWSPRSEGRLVSINCAALPEHLVESELFGHERGAFTGATNAKPGLVEHAHGGTLFLDEVAELPLPVQTKLLRFLEGGEYRRVGGVRDCAADVRIVAATNRDLDSAVQRGAFRSDLLYRVNGFSLEVPPLRSRSEEILPFARLFVGRASRNPGAPAPAFDPAAARALERYRWPGNLRELRNVVERAVLLAEGGTIELAHLPPQVARGAAQGEREQDEPEDAAQARPPLLRSAVEEAERERIVEALAACAGNQTAAAKMLGISRRTLVDRLDRYGLPRPRKPRRR